MKFKSFLSILVAVIAFTGLSVVAEDVDHSKHAHATEAAKPEAAKEAPAPTPPAPTVEDLPELPEFSADTVVLKINDKKITLGDLDQKLADAQVPEYQKGSYYPRVLEMMAQEIIQQEFIAAKGLKVDEEAYAEKLADLQKRYEEILERLKKQVAEAKGKIKQQLVLDNYTEAKVTDEAIAKYIEANPHMFDGSKVTVSHVLIECKSFASSEEKTQAKEKLQGIYDKIIAGEITFEDAAKENSSCPSKDKGGDLGEIEVGGQMDPIFTEMAFLTAVGDISKPFLTNFGWHIVKITDAKLGEGKPIATKVRGRETTPEDLAKNVLSAKVQNEVLEYANTDLKIENMGLPAPPKMPAGMGAMPGM